MDRILQQSNISEVDRLFGSSYDLSQSVVFFPIRHHSPACSFHLREAIKQYEPDAILIEGPADADHLIPYIAMGASEPPFCVYYSYDDQDGLVNEQRDKYRAYYPFLAYSPELVAIREAVERNLAVHFIDMPYSTRLVNQQEPPESQFDWNENEKYDLNSFTTLAAQKAGCRSFSELWESHYELNALKQSTTDFVKSVFAVGYFMREATPDGDVTYQEDVQREWYMAQRILEASETYSRILVVTGSFHVCGLLEQCKSGVSDLALKASNMNHVATYLMPYTFREADSKSGYRAGMPFPAFYQRIWEQRNKKQKDVYDTVALEYIVKTARFGRKTHNISIPDEINAYHMAKSLAQLRGKSSPGVYELLDGVRSTFVKGEIHSTNSHQLDFLLSQLSGMGAGTVAISDCIPPVVLEFRALCNHFRIKTSTIARQTITLEVIKKSAHYAKSKFLHQLLFLETGFGKLESGPDYVNQRDKNLVREIWTCRYSTHVETRLIDLSVYGTTLSQICASLIELNFRDSMTAAEMGKLLLSVQVMGIEGFYEQYADQLQAIIAEDSNFISLCQCLSRLQYLANMQRLMEGKVHRSIPVFIASVFRNAVHLMKVVKGASAAEEQEICTHLKQLYILTLDHPDWCDERLFTAEVVKTIQDGFCNSRIYGVCLAIHYKQGKMTLEEFANQISAYLDSCMERSQESASFICGIFLIARDILFASDVVLFQIDQVIKRMDTDTFLAALPNLRYAFTSFLPSEITRIAKDVAQQYDTSDLVLTGSPVFTQAELEMGISRDEFAAQQLMEWGLR